tara:strand:- start:74670 stop:74909 length:240 start_codon:yes stop_codon:yes gene_type:complete
MADKQSNIHINMEKIDMNEKQVKIMVFIMNALEKGWSIKKREEQFIFTKKHEGKKEVFDEKYLETFIQSNFDMNILKHT